MLKVGLSQRVDYVEKYQEIRDGLDQRWYTFLDSFDAIPFPLPNIRDQHVESLITHLQLDLIILTGGNTLAGYGDQSNGISQVRDEFEFEVLKIALDYNIKVLAVCRGMQCVNIFKGGEIHPVAGHVGGQHPIFAHNPALPVRTTVNSFHEWAIGPEELGSDLIPLASDAEGNIEAFTDTSGMILGLMWHPEREAPTQSLDKEIIRWLMRDQLQ